MDSKPIPRFSEQNPKTLRVAGWVRVVRIQSGRISRAHGRGGSGGRAGRQVDRGRPTEISLLQERRHEALKEARGGGESKGAAGPKPRGASALGHAVWVNHPA